MSPIRVVAAILILAPFAYSKVYCPLRWELAGFGNATSDLPPPSAVVIDPNEIQPEYVGRVFLGPEWFFGRIRYFSDGKIHVGVDELEKSFSSYHILTNPSNCDLQWTTSTKFGEEVPFSVSLESQKSETWTITSGSHKEIHGNLFTVGRFSIQQDGLNGTVQHKFLGGNVNPANLAISAGYDGKEIRSHIYQVLTSTFPPLTLELSDFRFVLGPADLAALEETHTQMELIGQDNLMFATSKTRKSSNVVNMNQKINHQKEFHETFQIEDEFSWQEVGLIRSVHLGLWFGDTDITLVNVSLPSTHSKTIKVDRKKRISAERDLQLQIVGDDNGSPNEIEVCSLAVILDNPRIEFRARGTFSSENLSGQMVSAKKMIPILKDIGRRDIREEGENVVSTEITGVLSGRFFIRTLSFISQLDEPSLGRSSCFKLSPKWLQTM